jgi:hypothetical protein
MNPSNLLSDNLFPSPLPGMAWHSGSPSLRAGATWTTTYEQVLGFQLSTPSVPRNNALAAGIRTKVQVANTDFLALFNVLSGDNVNVTVVVLAPSDFRIGITGVIHGCSQGKESRQAHGALERIG